jgi:hypothetical protein
MNMLLGVVGTWSLSMFLIYSLVGWGFKKENNVKKG